VVAEDPRAGEITSDRDWARPTPGTVTPSLTEVPRPHVAGRPVPLVAMRGIVKRYGSADGSLGAAGSTAVYALRGIDLRIDRGEFVAIVGPSGSGKSTLMNILGCLDIPTSGSYLIDGVDVSSLDEDDLSDLRSRKIGFVFQSFNLVSRTSAVANVELPLAYAGLDRTTRRQRSEEALRAVGMANRLHHQSSELSGGQQQRVAVARAIVTNPTLILADEPTGNLDSRSTEDVLRIFARLNGEGRTVVLITHEPDVAEQAKRVVSLSDGRVVEDRRVTAAHGPPPALGRLKSSHRAPETLPEVRP
jgi:putative ABC transport system ATP-binding protein